MSKKEERAKIVEVIDTIDFEKSCKDAGFTICNSAEESKGKKKANV